MGDTAPGNTEIIRSKGKRRHRITGTFFPNGSSAIANASNLGSAGFTVARSAAGLYTISLVDQWLKATCINAALRASTGPFPYKIDPVTVTPAAASPIVTLQATSIDPTQWAKTAADGAAGNATAETVIGRAAFALPIGHTFYFNPAAALTADNTNNAVITISKRTGGGGAVTVATLTTNVAAGNWTAWTAVPIVSTAAVAVGDVLTITITKGGTGVVVPAGVLTASGQMDIPAAAGTAIGFDLELSLDTVQA